MAEEQSGGPLQALRQFSENASPIDFVLILEHWQLFLEGIWHTITLVVLALVIGGILSIPLALIRANRTPVLNQIIWGYVYVFRGTPLLVQLYLIYYGLGQFEFVRESFLWPVLRELGVAPAPETERLREELGREFPALAESCPAVETDDLPERAAVVESNAALRQRSQKDTTGRPRVVIFALSQADSEPPFAHLTDGLAEDMAAELGRFSELEIVAPASAFAYRDSGVGPMRAASELNADFALCGSLRVEAKRFRISVQLIEVASERQVWADRYDCELDEVFAAQDQMVARIVGVLVGRIESAMLREAQRKRPNEWAPYDLWLRGWQTLRQPRLSAIVEAREWFRQAIALDQQFARPYIGLALAHLNEWACYSWNHWAFPGEEVLELARTALRLDEQDNRAHCVIGATRIYLRDYTAAERHFSRALELNPNDADVLAHASWALALIGEHATAVELGHKAFRLAPHFPEWYVGMVSVASFAARRYAEAIETIATAPEADCRMPAFVAAAYAHAGQPDKSVRYRDTLYRHYRNLVTDPDKQSCVQWLLSLDPFQHPEDTDHHEQGLRKAGFE